MKKIFVAAGLASILALGACGAGPRGTVTEKEIEVTTKKGKIKTCYELEITDSAGTETDICVAKSIYDSYEVGNTYPRMR